MNLPPDGSPQDLGKASSSIFLSRIHTLQQSLFWGREGKGTIRRHIIYIFHNSFKLAHEYPLISGPGLRKWEEKTSKSPGLIWELRESINQSYISFFLSHLVPSLGRKVLFLHEAQERTEIGFKFLFSAGKESGDSAFSPRCAGKDNVLKQFFLCKQAISPCRRHSHLVFQIQSEESYGWVSMLCREKWGEVEGRWSEGEINTENSNLSVMRD